MVFFLNPESPLHNKTSKRDPSKKPGNFFFERLGIRFKNFPIPTFGTNIKQQFNIFPIPTFGTQTFPTTISVGSPFNSTFPMKGFRVHVSFHRAPKKVTDLLDKCFSLVKMWLRKEFPIFFIFSVVVQSLIYTKPQPFRALFSFIAVIAEK